MKRHFVAIAIAATAVPGIALADITLFGDARLGLGYNIFNNGDVRREDRSRSVPNPNFDPALPAGPDNPAQVTVVTSKRAPGKNNLRAVSRVRFGVNMTGESDAGITFGATIRADNAPGGQGGTTGQRSGSVFVSGSWGTLTYGDVDGADYKRVGDPIGNASLTGLDDYNELPFLSNGGGSDNDALQFLAAPEQRPTVRYDYDIAGFGLSLSTNRDLNAVAVGASYDVEFDGGSVTVGGGYYDFQDYEARLDNWGLVQVPSGNQWSASLRGRYGAFQAGVGYTSLDLGSAARFDVVSGGVGATVDALTVLTYYSKVTSGNRLFGEALDGADSYGASFAYNLGGGLRVSAGVARSYGIGSVGVPGSTQFRPRLEAVTLADFGLNMRF